MKYDYVVIGGGSAGYVAGSVLARKKAKTLVIEKEKFGGVCVNAGCVPSIFLSDISFILSRFQEIGNYKGLSVSVENGNFFKKRDEIVEYLSSAGRKLVEDAGSEVELGEAKISGGEILVNEKKIEFNRLILASGSIPNPPRIRGIENAISEDEAVNLHSVPESMVVIGGGYAGVEIAQFFARLGSKVSLLTRGKIISELDSEARSILLDSLEWDGIEVIEGCCIRSIEGEKVLTDKGEFRGEIVVYATGRRPNLPVGIGELGLEIREDGIVANQEMRTSNPKILVAGDVVNRRKKVAHVAMLEGIISSLNAMGGNYTIDYLHVPQVIYTDPQIAVAGDKGRAIKISKFPLTASTRALIRGEREGYAKIGIDCDGKIVYGEVVADTAEDLINLISLAIRAKMTCEEIAFSALTHPSLSEAIENACRSFFNLDVDRFKGMKD
ncbi:MULTISPECIES: NAD(P)/FAD-dependent oxidoreductase [Acidianus]|uniref:Pyridine nucleotide-disulfide oxidoreductase n=1 Tax=Candidatus Acidianus copahuensis TaxID=1160895 RepID=A0A031LRI8_9CREN|nr:MULTISPECIES: NAD(P)/FAD-dependent oxidoreductase [Acidianus]EZQ07029.1 pyridine nucleotide-disulfide oxidoreductase [Candidatus Acidianus copahuensis]NON63093.1 NAD(P)/FAD-dependent oxidoreductase [Acidianus sp. RZ1]